MQDTLRRLLLDKREALKQLAEIKRGQLEQGRAAGFLGGTEAIKTSLQILEIDLQLAQSQRERIAVREKMVGEARKLEESAQAEQKSATGGVDAVVEARVKRLDYQIKLEEEKAAKP